MRLTDLAPEVGQPNPQDGAQLLRFLCPKCRRHQLAVEIWSKPHGETSRTYPGERPSDVPLTLTYRVWHAEQGPHRDWDTLSLSPSIDRGSCGDRCGGWHGHIINGEIVGGI